MTPKKDPPPDPGIIPLEPPPPPDVAPDDDADECPVTERKEPRPSAPGRRLRDEEDELEIIDRPERLFPDETDAASSRVPGAEWPGPYACVLLSR